MDREVLHAAVHGVTKSQTWLSDWTELKSHQTIMVLAQRQSMEQTRSLEINPHTYGNLNFESGNIYQMDLVRSNLDRNKPAKPAKPLFKYKNKDIEMDSFPISSIGFYYVNRISEQLRLTSSKYSW